MKRPAVLMLALSVLILGVGCGRSQPAKAEMAKVQEYMPALDFMLNDANGDKIKLSDSKGKVIILNFFSTSCPPCRYELPDFEKISAEFKDTARVLAVNLDGWDGARLKKFAENNNLTFPLLLDDGKVSEVYGPIRAIPVTYVIDKNFNIAKKYIGARTGAEFRADIEALK